jgi:outer membrane protein OmpA-like peptidoglycan-associated protein
MAEDWSIDVRKYAPDADDAVIAAIVRYCGIALQSRDASMVSFTDPVETGRVRDNYCRKKLGLTESDADIDAAIARVGERMNGDGTRNRVTVYYLLAEAFGKLGLFGAAATAAPVVAAPPPPVAPVAASPLMAASAAAPAAAAPRTVRSPVLAKDDGGIVRTGALVLCGLVAVLGIGYLGSIIGDRVDRNPIAAPPAPATPISPPVAAAEAASTPQGSGVIKAVVLGLPRLSVYFDTASSDVTADFDGAAADIKAYADANPDARFDVSGYNDPRGDAAMNAELSKARAVKVAAALVALGIAANRIDLEKPPETTDTSATMENARRVDVMVESSPAS